LSILSGSSIWSICLDMDILTTLWKELHITTLM
jgi:hypothetical protein